MLDRGLKISNLFHGLINFSDYPFIWYEIDNQLITETNYQPRSRINYDSINFCIKITEKNENLFVKIWKKLHFREKKSIIRLGWLGIVYP